MGFYNGAYKVNEPAFYGYDSANSSGVSGWKNIRFNTIAKDSHSGWNGTNNEYTPPVAGYYHCIFSHGHTNNGHDHYQTRIAINGIKYASDGTGDGWRSSCSCIAYFNGSSDKVVFSVYYSNTAHSDDNDDRLVSAVVYRLENL